MIILQGRLLLISSIGPLNIFLLFWQVLGARGVREMFLRGTSELPFFDFMGFNHRSLFHFASTKFGGIWRHIFIAKARLCKECSGFHLIFRRKKFSKILLALKGKSETIFWLALQILHSFISWYENWTCLILKKTHLLLLNLFETRNCIVLVHFAQFHIILYYSILYQPEQECAKASRVFL